MQRWGEVGIDGRRSTGGMDSMGQAWSSVYSQELRAPMCQALSQSWRGSKKPRESTGLSEGGGHQREPAMLLLGFPGGSDGKEFACSAGDPGSIPGSGRPPGEGNGYPFQYSCLESSMDRGDCWIIVHGVTKSRT